MRFAVCLILLCAFAAGVYAQDKINPDRPARGSWDFDLKKVWEIDSVGEQSLAKPAELRVAGNGAFYFHDFDRHVSYACDAQGKLIRSFAERGQGEGQVSHYMNCLAGDDRIVILSPDKLYYYTGDGEYVRSVPNNIFQSFPLLYLGGETFLFGPGALTDARGGEASIIRRDTAKGETAEMARLSVSDEESQGPPGAMVLGLTPQVSVAHDPDSGVFYYGKNSEYKIHAVNDKGKALKVFGLERARVAVTEDSKRAHFTKLKIPTDRVEKLIKTLPNQATYYYRIEAHRGLVYVFPVGGFGEKLTRQSVDIFSSAGEYLYRGDILFESGKHLHGSPDNLRFQDECLYVILEDDAGRKTIAKYTITLPGE